MMGNGFDVRATTRLLGLVCLLMLSLALAACGSLGDDEDDEALSGRFAGRVAGSQAFIGVVVGQENNVLAYVCDSEQVGEWFRGAVALDGSLDLTSASGERLQGTVNEDGVTGALVLGGEEFEFDAAPTQGDDGLYRAAGTIDGVEYVGGWVVLDGGEQTGIVRGSNGTNHSVALDVASLEVKTTEVVNLTADLVDNVMDPTHDF